MPSTWKSFTSVSCIWMEGLECFLVVFQDVLKQDTHVLIFHYEFCTSTLSNMIQCTSMCIYLFCGFLITKNTVHIYSYTYICILGLNSTSRLMYMSLILAGEPCLWISVSNVSPPSQPVRRAWHPHPSPSQRRGCRSKGSTTPHTTWSHLQLWSQVRASICNCQY